ncbi:MAG: hypothetical protein QOF61_643 [Acidobacteriota bacterium]|jgi:hypothetical protein|nr:hypothetical protein [Acidobacteriota bacterium]
MLKRTKLAIYLLTAVAAISVAVSAYAQTQTHSHTQTQPQSQAQTQPPDKTDQHGTTMSHDSCPMMQGDKSHAPDGADAHAAHLASVNARGEQGMGFSQTATTHHFLLMSDGGAIQVEVNDPKDASSRDQIRMHFAHIAEMFAAGNFDTPMFVHDQVPPGVAVMQKLKAEIAYRYEETQDGARVRISTRNREARAAVHSFLRFQIKDHQTGDPLEVSAR